MEVISLSVSAHVIKQLELLWGISAFIVALSVSLNRKIVNYQTNTFHQVDRLSIYYFHSFNDPASFVPKLENYREIFDGKEALIPIEVIFLVEERCTLLDMNMPIQGR